MNQIGAKLAKLLLCSGDHAGDLSPLADQRQNDMTPDLGALEVIIAGKPI